MSANDRYIFDPLYGISKMPDLFWQVLRLPELQRLREVRMCNINSLCLIGGANISRYEHAVGTFRLAQECIGSWPAREPLTAEEQRLLLLSALFHDVASSAFGHSVEYIESLDGFEHERAFARMALGSNDGGYDYASADREPFFFGLPRGIASKVPKDDIRKIGDIIAGRGHLGPLLNSAMDLDNIDNVYRMAYHIGLVRSGDDALKLARSLSMMDRGLIITEDALPQVKSWHNVRKRLYELLLLNPEDYSAKCMLTDAIVAAKRASDKPFSWQDVDFQLVERLSRVSADSSVIVQRLMSGDLYGCVGIFSTTHVESYRRLLDAKARGDVAARLFASIRDNFRPRFRSAAISLHPILDVNKTERQVRITTDSGRDVVIGASSNRLLIGVFFRDKDLSMSELDKLPTAILGELRERARQALSRALSLDDLVGIDHYNEASNGQ